MVVHEPDNTTDNKDYSLERELLTLALEQAAGQSGFIFIDPNQYLSQYQGSAGAGLFYDNIHFNLEGERVFSEYLINTLSELNLIK